MHVPAVSNETDAPVTVHTAGVVDENDTGKPDETVALTPTGDWANVASASGPKVIDCPPSGRTLKLCWAGLAAA